MCLEMNKRVISEGTVSCCLHTIIVSIEFCCHKGRVSWGSNFRTWYCNASTNIPAQRNMICLISERRRLPDIGIVCRGSCRLDRPFAVH
jgi:hypothetical protein